MIKGIMNVDMLGFSSPELVLTIIFTKIWSKDSVQSVNEGFAEIGRIINLYIAAGIPKENLEIATVIHGKALNTNLKNDLYQKKFKTNNPNLDILKQFTALNAQLLACGQAEIFFHMTQDDLLPEVKTAFSAQIVLSSFQLKGYVLYNIQEDK
jgi:intracellular sulfur oxidation DsrE/DsrF family protein